MTPIRVRSEFCGQSVFNEMTGSLRSTPVEVPECGQEKDGRGAKREGSLGVLAVSCVRDVYESAYQAQCDYSAYFYERTKKQVEGYNWRIAVGEVVQGKQVERALGNDASCLFANLVTSDGDGASILLYCPWMEGEKRTDKNSVECPLVPHGYVPDVDIGPGPGMRALCTAVREALYPHQDWRHESRPKERKRKKMTKKKKEGPLGLDPPIPAT